MHRNILWKGQGNETLEHCMINAVPGGLDVNSVILGESGGMVFKFGYRVKLSPGWGAMSFVIKDFLLNKELFSMASEGNGSWKTAGDQPDEYSGCADIDISLTPFTHSLPINRLNLDISTEKEINVLYIDALSKKISVVRRRYTRLGQFRYRYEDPDNGHQAYLQVDHAGIITDYPGMFREKHQITFN